MIREAVPEIYIMQLDEGVTLVIDHVVPNRDEDEYGDYPVALVAKIESINTPLKIDVITK